MAIIEPFEMLESTNLKEHNQIVNKLNEVVDAINGFNPDLQTYDRATIDLKDDAVLTEAKAYADTVIPVHDCYTKEQVDTKDSIVLTEAKTYADNKDVTVFNEAKAYADTKQPKLIAGNGIEINGNTISATGGTGNGNLSSQNFSSWGELFTAFNTNVINGQQIEVIKVISRKALRNGTIGDIQIFTTLQPNKTTLYYSMIEKLGDGLTTFAGSVELDSSLGATLGINGVRLEQNDNGGGQVVATINTSAYENIPIQAVTLLYKVV